MKRAKQSNLMSVESAATPATVRDAESEFIKVEKNIATFGFFTPTSNKNLKKPRVKTVLVTRAGENNKPVETTIRIVTGGDYGLPGTADLDKFLAVMKLVTGLSRHGALANPISFTSWELLETLGVHARSGKNYEGVGEWLDRMCATTMEVIGKGQAGGIKAFGKDRGIQVFERGVSFGRELEPGVVADRNYIWLAQWLLNSINAGDVIPIDFEMYRALKNPIAKTLVPLLQIWLYTTRAEQVFTKRYDALCQLLGIKQYPNQSLIVQKLGPSLEELTKHGLLAGWGIERTRGGEGFKVVLKHGEKFKRDLEAQKAKQPQLPATTESSSEGDRAFIMLTVRQVSESRARQLIRERKPGQIIEDQIEWIDELILQKGRAKIKNPPGLYITLIAENTPIPPDFETNRMRRLREEMDDKARDQQNSNYLLRCAYDEYVRAEVSHYLQEMAAPRREQLMREARERFNQQYRDAARVFTEDNIIGVVMGMVEKEIEPEVNVLTIEQFTERHGATSTGA